MHEPIALCRQALPSDEAEDPPDPVVDLRRQVVGNPVDSVTGAPVLQSPLLAGPPEDAGTPGDCELR